MSPTSKHTVIRLPDGPVAPFGPVLRRLPRRVAGSLAWLSGTRRRKKPAFAVQAAKLLLLSSALAANAPPRSGLEAFASRVPDEQLGEMRGKFVRPNDVSYFGISMATSWQDSNNVTTSAILLFSIGFLHGDNDFTGGTPVVAVAWSRDCEGCADPAMDVTGFGPAAQDGYLAVTAASQLMPVGGLDSVNGAVQSQQIAGLGNDVTNSMQIAVVPAAAALQMDSADLQALSQSSVQTFADGSSIRFLVGANELGLSMTGADGGSTIRQSVNGALNQAAQHVRLNEDLNAVSNSMTITIGVDSLTHGQRVQIDNALSAMKDRM